MSNFHPLLQHLNPAVRAARAFPSLPTARVLISLTDFDLPFHRLIKKESIVKLRITPIDRSHPLLKDKFNILKNNLINRFKYFGYWTHRYIDSTSTVILFWFMLLDDDIQTSVIEGFISLCLNCFLFLLGYASYLRPDYTVAVILGPILLAFVPKLLYRYFCLQLTPEEVLANHRKASRRKKKTLARMKKETAPDKEPIVTWKDWIDMERKYLQRLQRRRLHAKTAEMAGEKVSNNSHFVNPIDEFLHGLPTLSDLNEAVVKGLNPDVNLSPKAGISKHGRKSIIQAKMDEQEKKLEPPESLIRPIRGPKKGMGILSSKRPVVVKVDKKPVKKSKRKIYPDNNDDNDDMDMENESRYVCINIT